MGKLRSRTRIRRADKLGKVASVASVASNFVPGGAIARTAIKGAGAVASFVGGGSGFTGGTKRRSRALNINKFTNQLIRAKLKTRLMKEKLKVVNSIR